MSVESWVALHTRVLCDSPSPGRLDAAYLFGQSPDNAASVIDRGVEILERGEAAALWICGAAAGAGYAGASSWLAEIDRRGFGPRTEVVPFDPQTPLHTRSEAEALVDHALARGAARLAVVAAPFHQVRAFATTAGAIARRGAFVRIWSRPGMPLSWLAPARHSQGESAARRSEWIAQELARLMRYGASGDLMPAEQLLNWLDRRDSTTGIGDPL